MEKEKIKATIGETMIESRYLNVNNSPKPLVTKKADNPPMTAYEKDPVIAKYLNPPKAIREDKRIITKDLESTE